MVGLPPSPRKRSTRHPFRQAPWDDQHPDFRRIDATLPADHHARWICTVVARLDLSALRQAYAGRGSLAYPVELLLACVLFLYAKGILSPAQWLRCARYDDQAKWLLRGLQPSRSLWYTFRDRLEPFLDRWHGQLVGWAVACGITAAARASLDGTFVASLASRHQLFSSHRIDRRLLLLGLLIGLDEAPGSDDLSVRLRRLPQQLLTLWVAAYLLGGLLGATRLPPLLLNLYAGLLLLEQLPCRATTPGQPHLPAWVPATPNGRRRVWQRYEQARQRLAHKRQPYQDKKRLGKKDQQALKRMKVSVTDPEAALGWDKLGTYRPLYNVLLVQATDAALTLAWEVVSRNNDDGLLQPMVEKTHQQLGYTPREMLVDGAFVSVGEVAWCEGQGITVYAPPGPLAGSATTEPVSPGRGGPLADRAQATVVSGGEGASKGKASKGKAKKYGKEAFSFDGSAQEYICPAGKRLHAAARTTEKRSDGRVLPLVVYRASGADCTGCSHQRECTSNPGRGRVVKRYAGEEALERLRQRMAAAHNQEVYKERARSVELGYADIKEHRGLRGFRSFGKKRARVQAGLVILASNGLKIVHALQRRQSTEPAPIPQVE